MQHQIELLQKDVQLYKLAIDSLMGQKQKDHASILDLQKQAEQKDIENKKIEKTYNDIVNSLVDQIKKLGEKVELTKKENQSLMQTLSYFKDKSKKLNEQSSRVRKLKKFIKHTNEILDDVVFDGEDLIREL